ncbi:hypothetical protein K438DRAFT_1748658 [Mycena galopus ATCC 62051]|nr:hypothetical protein K438DRAFT_1748658 [Mycena galopus ATCC 62051]
MELLLLCCLICCPPSSTLGLILSGSDAGDCPVVNAHLDGIRRAVKVVHADEGNEREMEDTEAMERVLDEDRMKRGGLRTLMTADLVVASGPIVCWRGEILRVLLKQGFSSFLKTFTLPPALFKEVSCIDGTGGTECDTPRGSFPAAVMVAAGGAEAIAIAILGTGGDHATTFTVHNAQLLTQSAAIPLCTLPSTMSTTTKHLELSVRKFPGESGGVETEAGACRLITTAGTVEHPHQYAMWIDEETDTVFILGNKDHLESQPVLYTKTRLVMEDLGRIHIGFVCRTPNTGVTVIASEGQGLTAAAAMSAGAINTEVMDPVLDIPLVESWNAEEDLDDEDMLDDY